MIFDGAEGEELWDLRGRHGIFYILLVCKYQHSSITQVLGEGRIHHSPLVSIASLTRPTRIIHKTYQRQNNIQSLRQLTLESFHAYSFPTCNHYIGPMSDFPLDCSYATFSFLDLSCNAWLFYVPSFKQDLWFLFQLHKPSANPHFLQSIIFRSAIAHASDNPWTLL